MLQDHNDELRKQNELLKNNNDALFDRIKQTERERADTLQIAAENMELRDSLDSERRRNEELEQRYYSEVRNLREEVKEKQNQIEMAQIDHEKQLFRLAQELKYYKDLLKNKTNKLE